MEDYEGRFDFHGLGQAIRKAREERGWTQKYVSELVGRGARTIMNIENKGQYPSFGVFVKLVTMFDIPVDQFIHADSGQGESSYRKELVGKLRGHDLHIGGGAPCSPHTEKAAHSEIEAGRSDKILRGKPGGRNLAPCEGKGFRAAGVELAVKNLQPFQTGERP